VDKGIRIAVCPIPKSPWMKGSSWIKDRVGKVIYQDWYRALVKSVNLIRQYERERHEVSALVVGEFENKDIGYEDSSFYKAQLKRLEINESKIIVLKRGVETIGQLDVIQGWAELKETMVVIVCSPFHWPRIWFETRKNGWIAREWAWGIPRPYEMVTDLVLSIIYPIAVWTGNKERLLSVFTKRRYKGTF